MTIVLEPLLDMLMYWNPTWAMFKIVFFVWLYHPSTQGSSILWHKIEKYVKHGLKYEKEARVKVQQKTENVYNSINENRERNLNPKAN